MYRIRATHHVSRRQLADHPGAKEFIIKQLLENFAIEMKKNNCLKISEIIEEAKDITREPRHIFNVEGFVMTPGEHKEAIRLLSSMIYIVPDNIKVYFNKLQSILISRQKEGL